MAEEEQALKATLDRYEVDKRRTGWALAILAASIVAKWFFGVDAPGGDPLSKHFIVYYATWGGIVLSLPTAYVCNGRMAERRGFCLGKHGGSPEALLRKAVEEAGE